MLFQKKLALPPCAHGYFFLISRSIEVQEGMSDALMGLDHMLLARLAQGKREILHILGRWVAVQGAVQREQWAIDRRNPFYWRSARPPGFANESAIKGNCCLEGGQIGSGEQGDTSAHAKSDHSDAPMPADAYECMDGGEVSFEFGVAQLGHARERITFPIVLSIIEIRGKGGDSGRRKAPGNLLDKGVYARRMHAHNHRGCCFNVGEVHQHGH